MTYSNYGVGLTLDEINAIDLQVDRNRKAVDVFLKNLPSNGKGKTKRVFLLTIRGGSFVFGVPKSSPAIGLSPPPTSITRLEPSYEHRSEVKTAQIFAKVNNRIAYRSHKEIVFLMYLTDPKISSNR